MEELQFQPVRMGAFPGPRSLALLERRGRSVPRGLFSYHPLFIRRAQGSLLQDVDGNVLIDFAGGLGCLNVGSTPPEVLAAVHEQAERFLFSCFHVAMHEPYIDLAERLVRYLPGDGPKKAMLVNSGAEAVENAIKLSRAFTKRHAIITFQNSFHGRTLMTLALTSKTKPYKTGFGPFPPEVYRLPFAYCYRCPIHLSYPQCEVACADLLQDAFENQVAPADVAGLIAEPVQGEGGFIVPPAEYLHRLQQICRKHGIVFIVDEIQTGIARTGTMFAFEHLKLEPDLVTISKSIAGGLPLSAVMGRAEIMDSADAGGLGGSFAGSPISCAAALKVLDKVEREDLAGRAREIGRQIVGRAERWRQSCRRIGDIRHDGGMVGIEFVEDPEAKEPSAEYVARLKSESLKRGLVIISAGTFSNVIRFLVPLVIDDRTLGQGLDILEAAMRALEPEFP